MRLRQGCAVVLALALAACQGAPPPRHTSPQGVTDAAALAASALERGDYARAAELYRGALAAAPESVPLHYGLGVSASHLERKAEAIRELSWVLEHGGADSSEVRAARRWLQSVGALRRPAAEEGAAREEPQDQSPKPAMASVHGRVLVGETAKDTTPAQRMQLFLMEHPSRVRYFRLRTDEQGYFRFQNVPPGVYKLTERAAGQPTWRLRLEVKPGQDVALELGPDNSTRIRDDFPDAS